LLSFTIFGAGVSSAIGVIVGDGVTVGMMPNTNAVGVLLGHASTGGLPVVSTLLNHK